LFAPAPEGAPDPASAPVRESLPEVASAPAPASAEVVQWVKQRLLDGRLSPGQRLPPERQLAFELGVSRLPLREGLKWLQARGLVSIHHGRGGFIGSTPDPEVIADALLPLLIEAAAAGPAASPYPQLTAGLEATWKLLESELAAMAARNCGLKQAAAMPLEALAQAVQVGGGTEQAGVPGSSSRDECADEWDLHAAVAELSGQRLLQVLHQAIGLHVCRWLRQSPPTPDMVAPGRALRQGYAAAVAAGREADARRLAGQLIDQRLAVASAASR